MNTGVYAIVNTVNGKRYVGSAVSFRDRWDRHKSYLRAGQHPTPPLQRAWAKHGEQAFEFHRLLICKRDDLLFYEQLCLNGLKPEYNCSPTAGSQLGVKRSLETRRKISTALKGRQFSAAHRANLRAAQLGKKASDEAKANLSAALRRLWVGRVHPNKGRKHTEATRAKVSAAGVGRAHSEQTRLRMSAAAKAVWGRRKATT